MTTGKLWKHQQALLDAHPAKCLIAWECGLGKSLMGIELALTLSPSSALVICPKGLKAKWNRDLAKHPGVYAAGWKVVSKEEFKRDWETLNYYSTIIVDEFHTFAGMTSQLSKSLIAYIKKNNPSQIYGLTATPYTSSPWSVYRLATILGYKWNYAKFLHQFFYMVPMGGRNIPMARPNKEEELAALVKRIGNVVKMEECFDIPEQIFETEYFELTPAQKKAVKDVKMNEINPVVKWTKIHQIENGALKGDEYNATKFFDSNKHDRIVELAEENGKIAVFCRYNAQIDALKALLEEKGLKAFVIRGDVKDRDEVTQEIERTEKCVAIIQSDVGIGFELPSISVIVFASMSFSYVAYEQSLGRFLRANALHKNVYINLLTEAYEELPSVDSAVYDSVMKKQDFSIAIYDKEI